MINKATKQIINVTGDLHGGCLHFLAAGYSLFDASLIQTIQTLLELKCIIGTYVTKWYQQASGLALLISDELENNLYTAYFLHIVNDDEQRLNFEIFEDENSCLFMLSSISFSGWSLKEPLPPTSDFLCPLITSISWIFIGHFVFQREPVIMLWLNWFTRIYFPFSWLLGRLTF